MLRNINTKECSSWKREKNQRKKIISYDLICKLYGSLFCLNKKMFVLSVLLFKFSSHKRIYIRLHTAIHRPYVQSNIHYDSHYICRGLKKQYVHFFRFTLSHRIIHGNKNKYMYTYFSLSATRWIQCNLAFSLHEMKLQWFL